MHPTIHCPACGAARPPGEADTPCPACTPADSIPNTRSPATSPGNWTAPPTCASPAAESPASPPPPPTGGPSRYEFSDEIGHGGMGSVLKARDPILGRDLAIKVLLDRHSQNPELVRRFVEEAQIGGQLQHPGVVPVYELGEFADRRPYFAMKLVKGRTLAALLAERPDPAAGLPPFLSIFEQVTQTVAYAHSRGVIHRDLKPLNVMVGSFGEVQLMDWGLAKVLGPTSDTLADAPAHPDTVVATVRSDSDVDASQPGSLLGTPSYAPPEQSRGEIDRIDARADVFALGAMLCEILTGLPAYHGRDRFEVLRKSQLGDLADALARLNACGADAELIALARHCLAPEPADRPLDAAAVAAAMTAYLAGVQDRLRVAELARVEAQARAEEESKRARVERHRRRLAVALAASLLLTCGLAGGVWVWIEARRARVEHRIELVGRVPRL